MRPGLAWSGQGGNPTFSIFSPSKQCKFGFPPMTRAVSWVEPSVRSHNYAKGNAALKDVDN